MKILMVSSFLPYPITSGGHIRLYNTIIRLSKHHEITLVAEMRTNQTDADIAELKKYCKAVYTFQRKKQWTIQNICKAFFSLDSFLVVGHTLPEMKSKIADLLSHEDFDIIDVETFYVMQNLPTTTLPIVLMEHNIEYQAYEKFTVQKVPSFLRPLFLWDVWKMQRAEEACWKSVTKLVSLSPVEAGEMGRKDVIIAPNGVDTKVFTFVDPKKKFTVREKKILFIGTFQWIQNVTSCRYILQKIWPALYAKCKAEGVDISMWVVGRSIPESIKALGSEGVIFDENADEASVVFASSHVLLFPVSIAVGTSLKLFEAMASGLPVVTSPLGIRGTELSNGENVLLAQSEDEFIDGVYRLLTDEKLYTFIAKNAREYVEKNFSWDEIIKHLEKEAFS